jgi:hypothetical protein
VVGRAVTPPADASVVGAGGGPARSATVLDLPIEA